MTAFEWQTVEHQNEEISGRILCEVDEWSLVVLPEFDGDTDKVLCQRNGATIDEIPFGAANAADLTPDGTAIVADWIEYGERTDSEIHLFHLPDNTHRSFTVEYSSPLVAITPDASAFAITNYDGKVNIYDSTDFSLQAQHSVLFGDRLIPSTTPGDDDHIYLRARNEEPTLEYSIDLSGDICSLSNAAERIQYIESFTLENTTDWSVAVPELIQQYTEASTEYTRERVTNVFDDASLAHVSDDERLSSIIEVLEQAYNRFSDPHSKAVAVQLGDAHYRIGKEYRKQGQVSEFFKNLEIAEAYAEDALPWFAGKQLLAKIHRRQARVYKQRGDINAAKTHIGRVFELEEEFDVSLASDADKRLRSELEN